LNLAELAGIVAPDDGIACDEEGAGTRGEGRTNDKGALYGKRLQRFGNALYFEQKSASLIGGKFTSGIILSSSPVIVNN